MRHFCVQSTSGAEMSKIGSSAEVSRGQSAEVSRIFMVMPKCPMNPSGYQASLGPPDWTVQF